MEKSPGTELILWLDPVFNRPVEAYEEYADLILKAHGWAYPREQWVDWCDFTVEVKRQPEGTKEIVRESMHTFVDYRQALEFSSNMLYNRGRSCIITSNDGVVIVMARVR